MIDAPAATFLMEFLPRTALRERAQVLQVGVVSTHVHVLVRMHPSTNISRLLQRFKGASAYELKRNCERSGPPINWAKGYSIASVGERALDVAAQYVRGHPAHHPAEAIPDWPESGRARGARC